MIWLPALVFALAMLVGVTCWVWGFKVGTLVEQDNARHREWLDGMRVHPADLERFSWEDYLDDREAV